MRYGVIKCKRWVKICNYQMKKCLFISIGSLSLILGLCGLFTPGLPTTPFILLTGTLYAKSSPGLYSKLQNNTLTGKYLKRMENGPGLKTVLFSILLMWCMVTITAFLVFDKGSIMRFIILVLGAIGTLAQIMIYYIKQRRNKIIIIQNNYKEVGDIDCMND